jgi:hypothetical protein
MEAQKKGDFKKKDYGIFARLKGFLISLAFRIMEIFT